MNTLVIGSMRWALAGTPPPSYTYTAQEGGAVSTEYPYDKCVQCPSITDPRLP